MKIGIKREGKVPPDSRVPLIPSQCAELKSKYGFEMVVQPSSGRCMTDDEYEQAGISLQEDLSDCDILLGVKEVPEDILIPNKKYFFFSHTIKEQPYNRDLLLAVLANKIQLCDYEVLCNASGQRLIAFGVFAGMVGAHNGLMTYGRRTGDFELPRMHSLYDYEAAKEVYGKTDFPKLKIVLTGTGRVGSGAATVLLDMGIQKVEPKDFIQQEYEHAVFTQLSCEHYVAAKDASPFDKELFYKSPKLFEGIFQPYTEVADIMINGIYWDSDAPVFFTVKDMLSPSFNIKVIADVTCDLAPISSIPSTLFPSTIADPIFGFDPKTVRQAKPHQPGIVDMMTVDNLPSELPRDASKSFGEQFLKFIAPELRNFDNSDIIERATVAKAGKLGNCFGYLEDYVKGK